MPATRKKSPATTSKKKALLSTKARTGVAKPTKKGKVTSTNDGLYLQGQSHPLTHKVVSTVNSTTTHDSSQLGISSSSGQMIFEMLQKLDASNQTLAKRIDHIQTTPSFPT